MELPRIIQHDDEEDCELGSHFRSAVREIQEESQPESYVHTAPVPTPCEMEQVDEPHEVTVEIFEDNESSDLNADIGEMVYSNK